MLDQAKVIQVETCGNLAPQLFVSQSMDELASELPVPVLRPAGPQPAIVGTEGEPGPYDIHEFAQPAGLLAVILANHRGLGAAAA
jgi:hypothetical protein